MKNFYYNEYMKNLGGNEWKKDNINMHRFYFNSRVLFNIYCDAENIDKNCLSKNKTNNIFYRMKYIKYYFDMHTKNFHIKKEPWEHAEEVEICQKYMQEKLDAAVEQAKLDGVEIINTSETYFDREYAI